jgi:O-antigen/teichoic acid export membrane protein
MVHHLDNLRGRVKEFARSNLAALLTGQVFLALANVAILFMVNRVYARPGDTADAGRLAVVLSVMLAAVLLTTSGVARAVTLRLSRARADGGPGRADRIARDIGGGIVLGAVIGLALMVLGLAVPGIVVAVARAVRPEWADRIAMHADALQLGALWLPSYSMVLVMTAVFDGFQRMRWSLAAEEGTFQALRLVTAVLVILAAGWPWIALVGSWAAAYAVASCVIGLELWIFLKREGQGVAWRGLPLKGLTRDAAFLFLPTVAPMLFSQAGVLVAWAARGDTASATFWVAWSLSLAVSAFCGSVGRVLFPAIARLNRSPDRREMSRVLRRALWGTSAVAFAFLLAVHAVKGWLLGYLHQEGAEAILTVLLFAGFLEAIRMVFNPVLLASGMERSLTALEWLGLVAVLVGGFAAAGAWGVAGLAGVFVAVHMVSAVIRFIMVARATGVRLWVDAAVATAVVLAVTVAMLAVEVRAV